MNKRLIGTCFLAAVFTAAFSQSVCPVDLCNNKLRGKEIYIPKDLQGMDLQNPESKWSYHRMCCTDNVVVFWEKGFGNDLANPPQLEGHDMHVDLNNLTDKLEYFYTFFRDSLQFTKPDSPAITSTAMPFRKSRSHPKPLLLRHMKSVPESYVLIHVRRSLAFHLVYD